MSVYLIAQIDIRDRAGYAHYEAGFMDIFADYGGRLLSVDESPACLEGSWEFTRTVLAEFPSAEEARRWYFSDAYQELAGHRFAASRANLVMIKGMGDGP